MSEFDADLETIRNTLDFRAETCTQEEADRAFLVVHAAASSDELREVLEEQAAQLLRSEKARFWVLKRHNKVENLVSYRDDGKPPVSSPVGEGIAGLVAQDNGYYICASPQEDSLFVPTIDGLTRNKVRSQITAAVAHHDTLVGVLQVSNRMSGSFTENDAYWLQGLCEHGALAALRLKRMEQGWDLVKNIAAVFSDAVDDKHVSTVGHSDRTRQISRAIGQAMRLTENELLELELAALLHDIGRLALAPKAFEVQADSKGAWRGYSGPGERMHLTLTEAILRKLELPAYLKRVPEIATSHHEKADGSGYPKGKTNAELPLAARILAVANAFDMLTSGRAVEAQGKPLDPEEALRILALRSSAEFDPAVVDRLTKGKLYKVEKRRFPRYEYEAPIELTVIQESGETGQEEPVETEALNLSEGGILFRSATALASHALLKMKIHLPTESLDALARVARNLPGETENTFNVGAYFIWYGSGSAVGAVADEEGAPDDEEDLLDMLEVEEGRESAPSQGEEQE